ncbi:MAG: hypothetical protein KC731_21515, partial [Myxococcales bacterium]|nr:hypothetical protein [Myxococcales bacterium]
RCTTRTQFQKLFPDLAQRDAYARTFAAAPPDERLRTYLSDVYEHREQLLEVGEAAVGPLVEKLADEEDRWLVADLLGRLGVRDELAIEALRRHARRAEETCFHETIALALLGDVEWLIELAADERHRAVAVRGIGGLYGASVDYCRHRVPLDYRPLERLLELAGCSEHVDLDTSRDVRPEDLDELLRGVESWHPKIRRHAVRHLGDVSGLRRGAGKQAVPAIAARMGDRDAGVRQQAVISLHYWKKAAKPYLAEVKRLASDRNEKVSRLAKHYAKVIGEA